MSILQALIEQSKMPSGFLGRLMLKIMNNAHRSLTTLGLSKLQDGENILDVSCGGGNAISMMTKMNRFEHIYGVDIFIDAISLAMRINQEGIDRGQITIMQASVLNLPFQDNYFDAVTTFQSHYHWPEVLKSMREIYRVLKPGGQFILVAEIYKVEYHMKDYNTVEKTEALFKDSGFIDVKLQSGQKYICVIGRKQPVTKSKTKA